MFGWLAGLVGLTGFRSRSRHRVPLLPPVWLSLLALPSLLHIYLSVHPYLVPQT